MKLNGLGNSDALHQTLSARCVHAWGVAGEVLTRSLSVGKVVVRHGDLPQLVPLRKVWPMFRQLSIVALVVLAALGSLTAAIAQETKEAGGKKQITNSIGMKLVLIPAGEFKMGSGESAEATAAFFNKTYGKDFQNTTFKDEHPQHRVRITEPFYLGTYHVTRGQFRQLIKETGYKTDAEKGVHPGAFGWNPDKKKFEFNEKYSWQNAGFEQTDEHPVVNVSWNDAVAFCKWLSKKEGKRLTLTWMRGKSVRMEVPEPCAKWTKGREHDNPNRRQDDRAGLGGPTPADQAGV